MSDLERLEAVAPFLAGWLTAPHDKQTIPGWYVNPTRQAAHHARLDWAGGESGGADTLTDKSQGLLIQTLVAYCAHQGWEPNLISNWDHAANGLRWSATIYPRTATANAHAWGDTLARALLEAVTLAAAAASRPSR